MANVDDKSWPVIELAKTPWASWQRGAFIGLVLGLAAMLWLAPELFVRWWNYGTLALFGLIVCVKVLAVFIGQFSRFTIQISDAEVAEMPDEHLPVYTVLLPVYKEAEVLGDLIAALERMDYPHDRLDVKLLLEETDLETRGAARHIDMPSWIELLVVPDGQPRTKPRACNYGLARAFGEYLVIFDAEDRPDPDQLKKAVIAFRRLPDNAVCLQAKLNFYNGYQNLLTRWFTLEYSTWFDLYLPGLHALRSPVPLGGTSNHFKTEDLRRLGGWDAWNVTEDCDLGIRLSRAKKGILILDSTTWEEAPSRLGPWLKQRSRWIKGYWQTLLVHTRYPLSTAWHMGFWRFFMMLNTVGGQVLTLLLLPICWALLAWGIVQEVDWFDPRFPWTVTFYLIAVAMVLFNAYFVLIHLIGGFRRRYFGLLPYGLFLPIYWLMMSVGGWLGFLHFFVAPFSWLKTPHGLIRFLSPRRAAKMATPVRRPLRSAVWTIVPFTAGLVALVLLSFAVPEYLGLTERLNRKPVYLTGPFLESELKLEQPGRPVTDNVWLKYKDLRLEVDLVGAAPSSAKSLRAVVFLKALDGEWFQYETPSVRLQVAPAGRPMSGAEHWMLLSVPFDGGWEGKQEDAVWGRWCLRRIKSVGVRLYGKLDGLESIKLTLVQPEGVARPGAFQPEIQEAPREVLQNHQTEIRFTLGREYENPFDPDLVDVRAEFTAPSGQQQIVPAFYAQNYSRKLIHREERRRSTVESPYRESLRTVGAPYWAARYLPTEAGAYRWRLIGEDALNGEKSTFETSLRSLTVKPSDARGYLHVDEGQKFFSFANGEFFYPIAMNLCWPRDGRTINLNGWRYKNEATGTFLFDDFLKRMGECDITMGRTWMTPWWCGLEWRKDYPSYNGIGHFSLENAWKMDHLLEQSQRRGVMLEVAINHHGPWTTQWDAQWSRNPYFAANGGWLTGHAQAMTDPKTVELFKKRTRYCAARWGAHPNLFAWVLWIENDVVNRSSTERARWHKTMGEYLQEVDLKRHPVSTEFVSGAGDSSTWSLDAMDYSQAAAYAVDGFVSTLISRTHALRPFNKPALIEEYGGSAMGTEYYHLCMQIHNAPWIGWNIELAGSPMPWWWNMILEVGIDEHWSIFADYIRGEDLRGRNWRCVKLPVRSAGGIAALTRISHDRAYAWVYHEARAEHRFSPRGMFEGAADARLFDSVGGASLVLPGMVDGQYRVEFWDTWNKGVLDSQRIEAKGNMLIVPLRTFSRDFALKIIREEYSPSEAATAQATGTPAFN